MMATFYCNAALIKIKNINNSFKILVNFNSCTNKQTIKNKNRLIATREEREETTGVDRLLKLYLFTKRERERERLIF